MTLHRWIRLPAARARCVCHFLGIAATLATAKVLLSTIGVTLFVSEQGAVGLPPFYVGFAAIAILLSFGLSSIIDRVSKVQLAQITFAGLLVGTAALRFLLALDFPGVSFALLASATAFEIILDIVFWVVVAAYLDAFEFRRATPLVYMALALGGAAGGAVARVGAASLPPADLLFLLLPLAALVVVQFGAVARQLREVPENYPDTVDEADGSLGPVLLGRLLRRYPLALLIALNALVVTLLYGLSEFLILSIYEARFTSETELAEFLSLLFALMQIVEFGLLYTLTRILLERTGPLLRNLVFPLTSLGGLVFLVLSPRLLAAVMVHVNIEALSNALFLPIANANYVPLPLAIQGRARTLSEGIFYPIGLALAGAVLWTTDPEAALLQAEFAALMFAGLLVLLGAGIGSLFLPTLVRTMRYGIAHFAEVAERLKPPKLPPSELRPFIHSSDPSTRALGFAALKQQLDPTPVLDDLEMVAAHADRGTRTQIVDLLRGLPEFVAARFANRLLNGNEVGGQLVALLYLLGGCGISEIARLRALSEASPEAVAMLARLVLQRDDPAAITRLSAHLRADGPLDTEACAVLIDAVAMAGRVELTTLLLVLIELAPLEETEKALVALGQVASPSDTAAAACARRFVQHHDHRVRAAAIGALGAFEPERGITATLDRGLEDPNASVRQRATEALARHSDAAVEIVAARLLDSDVRVVKAAVRTLGRIGSRRACAVVQDFLEERGALGVRHLSWLGELSQSPDDRRFRALRFVLEESNRLTVALALEALAALGEERIVHHIHLVFAGEDRRRRAEAIEALLALRHRHLVTVVLPLLDAFVRSTEMRPRGGASRMIDQLIEAAARDSDPWVRAAARLARDRSVPSERRAGGEPSLPMLAVTSNPAGSARTAVEVAEAQLERVLFLKSIPLFRHLPLDTLRAVAEVLRQSRYVPGEEIIRVGSSLAELFILESGVVTSRAENGRVERLTAPALFGEEAMVEDLVSSRAVVAIEPCTLLTVHRTVFQDLANDYPDIVVELSRRLARRREDDSAVADKPSIAVLPFKNMSGDPDQEYFADGIAEDIITALSKYRTFLVIARNSSFAFRGEDHDLKHIARTLGVRYVVEGTVRRFGERVRITARLVDAVAGYQVWTERYDRELGDIFAVQDEITGNIASAVAPVFLSAEAMRAKRKDVRDLDTWEYVMRASWHHARCSQRDFVEAHNLLEKALALDPLNVGGLCLKTFTHLAEIQFGWTESPRNSQKAAAQAARTAVALDARDALAHTAVGFVDLMWRRYDDAIGRLEHAVSLNPNLAIAQGGLGQAYALSGDYEAAVAQIEKAIRLSPEDPFMVYWFGHLGLGAYAARRYDEAARWGAKAVRHNPDSPAGHRLLAASLAQLGRVEDARVELQELLHRMPGMTADDVRRQVPFKRQEDVELYIDGLRKAGLAE